MNVKRFPSKNREKYFQKFVFLFHLIETLTMSVSKKCSYCRILAIIYQGLPELFYRFVVFFYYILPKKNLNARTQTLK